MSILAMAKADILQITSDPNGFSSELEFISPTGIKATIRGTHSKHHLAISNEAGRPVNSKNAHAGFVEKLLTDLLYPVRNAKGEVYLKDHRLNVVDSTGIKKNYVIKEWYPDETLGFIVCILGDFKATTADSTGITVDSTLLTVDQI